MARKTRKAGTPTNTNLFALTEWDNDGCPARVHATSYPHLKRCMANGLIADGKLTEAGREIVGRRNNGDKLYNPFYV